MPAPREIASAAELDRVLASEGKALTVVDFHASWCGPCHAIAPVFERIGDATKDATFVRVDVDKVKDLALRYKVSAMPTFVFLRNGIVVDTLRGADPRGLQRLVTQHSGQEISSETVGQMAGPKIPWNVLVLILLFLAWKYFT